MYRKWWGVAVRTTGSVISANVVQPQEGNETNKKNIYVEKSIDFQWSTNSTINTKNLPSVLVWT